MEPKIFKADPQAITPSAKKAVGLLFTIGNLPSKFVMPRDNSQAFMNAMPTSPDDEIIVYDDHFERKLGAVTQTVSFKDITSINVTKNPSDSEKLLFIHVNHGSEDTIIIGMKDMEGILAAISSHVSYSIISEQQIWQRSNGFKKMSPWLWILIILLIIMCIALQYINK